jgi:hypothetical protein
MKKILLIFILSGSINLTFAQTIKFTITAGVNESTASKIPDSFIKEIATVGQTFPNSKLIGFHIGAFAAYPVGKISIQTGLLYTTKGGVPYSFSGNYTTNDYYNRKDVLRLNYLEVPLNILYNIPIGTNKVFIGGGPYIGIGISGKESYTITDNSPGEASANQVNKGSKSVAYGSGYDDIKGTDLGLGAKLGFALKKGWLISFNYEYGLTNLSNDPSYSGENKILSLSLGYSF